MTDTSREVIDRLIAALKDEAAMLDAVREDGLSTLLSNGTVDRLRLGLRAAYVVMDALAAKRDALRAEVASVRATMDRLDCTAREGGDTMHCRHDRQCQACALRAEVAQERTAREQAERALNHCEYMREHNRAESSLALQLRVQQIDVMRSRAEQAEARVRELEVLLSAERMKQKHKASLERLGRGEDQP